MFDGSGQRYRGKWTLLYDADCAFCRWSVDVILAWDRRRRLTPVAIQSAEGAELLAPVPPERRLDAAHVVSPEGELLTGAAAAPVVASLLPGGPPLAALLRRFPRATDRAYGWTADHRGALARLLRIDPGRPLRRR